MAADTPVYDGIDRGIDKIEKLADLTEKNVNASAEVNAKMIKLTTWIFWLTLVIGVFTVIQILPYFKFTIKITQYTLSLWKVILLVGLAFAFTGLVLMIQSKFAKVDGELAESVGGAGRPWWLRIGWFLAVGGFVSQVIGALMAP